MWVCKGKGCVWKWVLCICRCVERKVCVENHCGEVLTVLYFFNSTLTVEWEILN